MIAPRKDKQVLTRRHALFKHFAIVIESGLQKPRLQRLAKSRTVTGVAPLMSEYGKLAVIEAKPR